MNASLPLAALLLAGSSIAGQYNAALVADDQRTLSIVTARGSFLAPRTHTGQQGFSDARLSPDRNLVGWLVLTENCCTSYPLPTGLVVFGHGKVIRSITDVPPIFDWRFQHGGAAVAYRQRLPHGASTIIYKLRRVADGKVLAVFECTPDEAGVPGQVAGFAFTDPVPEWVWPIAGDECPKRIAGS